jgi:hypothetical protein
MSMDALVGGGGGLVFNSECDREPVKGFEDGGDVFIFAQPHQDPGSAVLYVLELLDALARDPDECIAVIQPGGDKGVDELLRICQGECRPGFGNVFEVVECGLAVVIDVGVIVQLLVHFNTQVGDRCGRGDVLARESDTGDVGGAELMWVPMRMASVVEQFN